MLCLHPYLSPCLGLLHTPPYYKPAYSLLIALLIAFLFFCALPTYCPVYFLLRSFRGALPIAPNISRPLALLITLSIFLSIPLLTVRPLLTFPPLI